MPSLPFRKDVSDRQETVHVDLPKAIFGHCHLFSILKHRSLRKWTNAMDIHSICIPLLQQSLVHHHSQWSLWLAIQITEHFYSPVTACQRHLSVPLGEEGHKASGRRDAAEQASDSNSIFYPAYHLQEEGNGKITQQIMQAMLTPKWQIHQAHRQADLCQGAFLNLAKKGNRHFQCVLCLMLRAAYSSTAAPSQCSALVGSMCGALYSPVSVLCALSSFINFKQIGGDVNSPLGMRQCLLNMLYIPVLILYWMVDVISL